MKDPQSVVRRCRFGTERLEVGEWRALAQTYGLDLAAVVADVLTARTTGELPPGWHGDYDAARATAWIRERDAESPTLLVVERETQNAVGLLLLFAEPSAEYSTAVAVRVGYVLAEAAWGRGLASELVGGLVEWARSEPKVVALSGGVAAQNEASARVLLKSGFEEISRSDGTRTHRWSP